MSCVYIFQDDCTIYFSKLNEVLLQLFVSESKVESTNEDLGLGVLKDDFLIVSPLVGSLLDDDVVVWLVHKLTIYGFLGGANHPRISLIHILEGLELLLKILVKWRHSSHAWHSSHVWHSWHPHSHATWPFSWSTGWFNEVVGTFTINSLFIDHVTTPLHIHLEQIILVFISLVTVFELHLDEAETASSVGLSIAHDDSVRNDAVLLKIFNKIGFYM